MAANKTSFVKGKSGNPGGRPKGQINLTGVLSEYLKEDDPKYKRQRALVVAEKLYEAAVKRHDVQAMKYIFDRIDGKVKDQIEADLGGGLKIEFVNKTAG
jgi:hypothetical protein